MFSNILTTQLNRGRMSSYEFSQTKEHTVYSGCYSDTNYYYLVIRAGGQSYNAGEVYLSYKEKNKWVFNKITVIAFDHGVCVMDERGSSVLWQASCDGKAFARDFDRMVGS